MAGYSLGHHTEVYDGISLSTLQSTIFNPRSISELGVTYFTYFINWQLITLKYNSCVAVVGVFV